MPFYLQASLKKRMMRVWVQFVQNMLKKSQEAAEAAAKVAKPPAKASAMDTLLKSSKSAEADMYRHVSMIDTSTDLNMM